MRRLNRGLFQVAMSQVALEDQEVVPTEVTPPTVDTTTAVADVVVPVAEVPAAVETPTEVVAAVDNVEVTVKVVTDGAASVEKTESNTTGEVVVDTPTEVSTDVNGTAAVAEEGLKGAATGVAAGMLGPVGGAVAGHLAEEKIRKLEAEIAELKKGAKPATEDSTVDVVADTTEVPVITDTVVPTVEVPSVADTTTTTAVDTDVAAVVPPVEETKTEASIADGEAATVLVKDDTGTVVATVNTTDDTTTVTTSETVVEVTQVGDKVEVEVTVTPEETPVETPAVAVEDMVIIETDGDEVEIEIQDAVDCAEDTAELVGEVDEAEDAAMALESLVEIAQSAAANGGLDEHGARILKVATEHIYQHMGLGKAVGIPAMESFRVDGARATATTIAMEDIAGQAKKIWQAVLDGIKKAAEWIQEFIKKILSANGRIKARAEKLLSASEKMTGAPKSKMVGDAVLVRSLTIGGRIPSNLAAEVKKAVDFFFNVAGSRSLAAISKVPTAISQAFSTSDASKAEVVVLEAIQTLVGKNIQFNNVANSLGAKVGIAEAPAGTSLSMSHRFCGEQVVWAYMPSSVEAITSFRSGIGIDTTTTRISEDAKANTLTPTQISEVAKVALQFVEVTNALSEFDHTLKELTKVVSVNLASAASISGSYVNDNAGGPNKAVLKSIIPVLKAARHLVKGIHQPAAVVATRVVNASLNLAAASAAQYTAKAA